MTPEELLSRYNNGERAFAGAVLKNARLDDTVLADANFDGGDFSGAGFIRARLGMRTSATQI